MIGLPLQATIVSRIRLFLLALAMIDIAHDGIEVAHNVGIALVVDFCGSTLEGIQRSLVVLLVKPGESGEIIKGHFIGVIQHSRLRQRGHQFPILCRPFALDELEPCPGIVGGDVEKLHQRRVDHGRRHLLHLEIGRAHLGHLHILGHHLPHPIQ